MRNILTVLGLILALASFGQRGIVRNQGQWEDPSVFTYRFGANAVFFTPDSIVFSVLHEDSHGQEHADHPHYYSDVLTFESFSLKTTSGRKFHWEGGKLLGRNQHYFVGDEENWRTNVPEYATLVAKDVYPGIDLQVYTVAGGIKYDWLVQPGAALEDIELSYNGLDKLKVGRRNLVLTTTRSTFKEELPRAYQGNADIDVDYEQSGPFTVGLTAKSYDTSQMLVVDPVYIFSTYSGSTSDNFGYTSTFDDAGNAFGGGIVFGAGYPTTLGAVDTTFAGGIYDVAVSKFSSDGTQLLWSTYLGGSNVDQPHSLECDENGTLYIFGITGSSDFGVTSTAFDTSFGGGSAQILDFLSFSAGTDVFVAAINAAGDSLIGSTYLGGGSNDGCNDDLAFNYGDSFRGEIEVQRSGGPLFLATSTQGAGYPITSGGKPHIGGQDGVLTVLSRTLDSLYSSTYVGTKGEDALYSIALAEKEGNSTNSTRFFLAGSVDSDSSFVFLGSDSLQISVIGDQNGLLVAGNYQQGVQLLAADATYDPGYDQHYFVEINHPSDTATLITVMGQNKSGILASDTTLWGQSGSAQYFRQYKYNPLSLGFDAVRTAVWGSGQSTQIDVSPTALLIDYCGNLYFSGWGGSPNYEGGTTDLTTTSNAPQKTTDGRDFYFVVLRKDWKEAEMATFWGGSGREHVDGGTSRFDSRGRIFQAVCAGCGGNSDYPAFPTNVYSTTNNSVNCNLAVTVIDLDVQQANVSVSAPLQFCYPNPLSLVDSSANVDIWDAYWGDGSSALNDTVLGSHFYPSPGSYNLVLVGQDTTCETWDTTALSVEVLPPYDSVEVSLTYDSCGYGGTGFNQLFASVRSRSNGALTPYDVDWTYTTSAGSVYQDNGAQFSNPLGNYGTNLLTATVYDPVCGITEQFTFEIEFKRPPSAGILADIPECTALDPAEFTPLYNTPYFAWFVNTDSIPGAGTLELTETGDYNITLVAYDLACSTSDSATIEVSLVGVDTNLAVPNVITPNSDGVNDTWRLTGTTEWDEFHIILYNRWGVKVFETAVSTFDWGADYDGKILTPGVYFYQVEARNKCSDIQQEGTLHITY